MSASPDLVSAIAALLGERAVQVTSGPRGQLGPTWRLSLSDGRRLFVKTFETGPQEAAQHEAKGLRWLADGASPPALVIPRVHGVRPRAPSAPGLLILDWIEEVAVSADADEAFGHALARLHRAALPGFGSVADNHLAGVRQDNTSSPGDTWAVFYRDRRLIPALARAGERARLPISLRHSFESLLERIEDLAASAEEPSRLHGDLWAGNRLSTAQGAALIDPAVYAGHREVDLAMMKLFGGFSRRVFDAYEESWPLEPGAPRRVALYQLYPLLIHVVLFGESYLGSVEQALRDLA